MIDYVVTFFAVFFTDIFYTSYLKAVQEEQTMRASLWAVVVFLIASIAVINYTSNYWLLIPAGLGAFSGTYVGMILRKRKNNNENTSSFSGR
jgi:general stress protein CsbA